MKTIDLKGVKYPSYFVKNLEESYKENIKRLKVQGMDDKKIESVLDKPDFNPIKIGFSNLLGILNITSQAKVKTWEQRKMYSKIVEKLYDVEEKDGVLEISDEQFDFLFGILTGEIENAGTAATYIAEEFERVKLEDKKENK
ncbi:MAG: hypothetical protein UV20_C0009G0046 [Candidatus Magasanikbacteria bacterium GW2011_GWA2_42_32]|uniref:Uncharacterized protein n=1 Tax=Candidatus Magasanikbacteria bacterium GW2011_GWA2_42_32 TaxID=1619039 RepID=A0A0G1A657_9BACT|nr:MAG: hypothetical protein UV20_C0009G0046 [Candidatus Magasanikbacteria bacterium GW2011_GWA2_42_32]HBX15878.1 hypothetical protein [Candidatus Magasanikbacteria bacterium]